MKKKVFWCLLVVCIGIFALGVTSVSAETYGIYEYEVIDGAVKITECDFLVEGEIAIPSEINGYPVTVIGNTAFFCSRLTGVIIPDSVTTIEDTAFWNCGELKNVVIPDSVTTIGDEAFTGCGLTRVTIPASVTSLGETVFKGCAELTEINVDSNNKNYKSVGGVLFDKSGSVLVEYPAGNPADSYVVPNSVVAIGNAAFKYCEKLKRVTLPDSVVKIGREAFYSCDLLESVNIPDSVTQILHSTFAFSGLKTVNIPATVSFIDYEGLGNCEKLTEISVDAKNKEYKSVDGILFSKDGTVLIKYPAAKTGSVYSIPDSVTHIKDSAFWGCVNLESVIIPDSVTSIGVGAFSDCKKLKSVDIPSSVKEINIALFMSCESLTNVSIPDTVTTIRERAFFGCKSLTSVQIPSSVTEIGESAFEKCEGLTAVKVPDSAVSIGRTAFAECTNLENVLIPDSVTVIGEGAFAVCSKLKNVTIPHSVTEIGRVAFNRNSEMSSITIPDSVTSIGHGGVGYYKIKDIYFSGTEDEWNRISIEADYGKYFENIPVYFKTVMVYVGKYPVSFDQQPIIENGRTLVPLRGIFEALGASVDWDNATQTVTAQRAETRISLQIGSQKMLVNGEEKTLDVPAKLINGHTLVPARAISEAFGCDVQWDAEHWSVRINSL